MLQGEQAMLNWPNNISITMDFCNIALLDLINYASKTHTKTDANFHFSSEVFRL